VAEVQNTKIDWADMSANPTTGCSTGGCKFCYARRFAKRLAGKEGTVYHRLREKGFDPFTPAIHQDVLRKLDADLAKKRKPQTIFLGSMSDLGSKRWRVTDVQDGEPIVMEALSRALVQSKIKKLIRNHPRHTFLILTKNTEGLAGSWPKNAWIGVSTPTSAEARERVPVLFEEVEEAGGHFVSIEPLLDTGFQPRTLVLPMRSGGFIYTKEPDWVVIGAETGAGKRPSTEVRDAAIKICDWCANHNVPVFVKDNLRSEYEDIAWPMAFPEWRR